MAFDAAAYRRQWRAKKLAEDPEYERRYMREYYQKNRASIRASHRACRDRNPEHFREMNRQITARWRDNHPEYAKEHKDRIRGTPKFRARTAVTNALAAGRLTKPADCSRCGCQPERRHLHAHHSDYNKPLDVTWLCSACHGLEHRQEVALGRR